MKLGGPKIWILYAVIVTEAFIVLELYFKDICYTLLFVSYSKLFLQFFISSRWINK